MQVCFLNIRQFRYSIDLFLFNSFNIQTDEDYICWNKDYKLTWNDFKGPVTKGPVVGKNKHTVAMASVSIRIKKSTFNKNEAVTKIHAIFDCNNSWAIINNNSAILKHEQGHFDIGEIFARKLRKKLNNKRIKRHMLVKKKIKYSRKISQQLFDYQNLYDKETEHNMNKEKQNEWNERIKKELQELDIYSNPEIILKLK